MIEINNLVKSYGHFKAVDDISFEVKKGEILGFLGPNGAGKTTTMNIITGYIPPTDGSVKVCGFDILQKSIEVKKRIGYLPENPPLYPEMTVREYLDFVCELKKVPSAAKSEEVDKVVFKVKIEDVQYRLIKHLSKGYKQRVGIAQALLGNPDVLILDEPTVGLDPIQIIEIRELIKELSSNHTIILSTHIMQEVSAVCSRVVIINKGKIVAIDTPDNLSSSVDSLNRVKVLVEGKPGEVKAVISSVEGVTEIELLERVFKGNDQDNKDAGEESLGEQVCECSFMVNSEVGVDIRKVMFFELAKNNMPILELQTVQNTLEDVFVQLTKEDEGVKVNDSNIEEGA